MTDDSERVRDHFASSLRDLTPAAAADTVRVVHAPVSPDAEVSRVCASVLSEAERQRAQRFAAEADGARFRQRRAFRCVCAAMALGASLPLSGGDFEETEEGRPFVSRAPGVWFSFSSCRTGLLGAWSSTHAVGVDLEDATRQVDATALARAFFSAAEARAVEEKTGPERLRTFFRYWTLKEAALKSVGEGLSFGLDAFEFELAPEPRVVHAPAPHGDPGRFRAHTIEGSGVPAALVIRTLAG